MRATRNTTNEAIWGVRREIDGQYFDGEGWTYDAGKVYRTDRGEAANVAAYLQRVTPGWVRVAVISD